MFSREDERFHEGTVIRPPSEAESLIVQLTIGCSDNRCCFCPAYKDKSFRVKDREKLEQELAYLSRACPDTRRIFFADGDALAAPQETLVRTFQSANRMFPWLSRISLYGSAKNILSKTADDLRMLRSLKLHYIYLGLESGDPSVYASTGKSGNPDAVVEACKRVREAGLRSNVTVILGLGGVSLTRRHAEGTAQALNAARPDQVAALSLMIVPGTPLHERLERGEFVPLDDLGHVEELRDIIQGLDSFSCQFFSNHASNYYSVAARFPRDRERILNELGRVLTDRNRRALRPDVLRGL